MNQPPLATLGPVTYAHITNAGTVLVKDAPGALLTVNVNSVGAASTVTMYDVAQTGTLGTIEVGILSLGTTQPIGPINMGPPAAGLGLNTGLVVVTTGTCDLTIGYR
jgi:hypothetical protein